MRIFTMTTAALPCEYSHAIERRLAAFLLAVVVFFSQSGILANLDDYRVGVIVTALPLLVAAYAVAGGADPAIHPASPGFARTLR